MLTREPETFWCENVITVVVLLRILPNMSLRRKQVAKCKNFYHVILRPGEGLTSWIRAAGSIAGVRGFEFRWGLYLSYSQCMFLIEVYDRLFTILFFTFLVKVFRRWVLSKNSFPSVMFHFSLGESLIHRSLPDGLGTRATFVSL